MASRPLFARGGTLPFRPARRARWLAAVFVLLTPFAVSAFAVGAAAPSPLSTEFRVIVNASNPVRSLSREDVAAYFLRRRTSWPDGGPVAPVDLPAETAVRDTFSRQILHRTPGAVSAYWVQEIFAGRSEPPPVKNTDAAIVAYVSSTPGAIGYVAAAAVVNGTVHDVAVTP